MLYSNKLEDEGKQRNMKVSGGTSFLIPAFALGE